MANDTDTLKPAPVAVGQRFGRLVALEFVDRVGKSVARNAIGPWRKDNPWASQDL